MPQNESETSTFSNADIELLCSSGKLPPGTIFRVPKSLLKSDYLSLTWTCFYEFLITIRLSFPFLAWISEFFEITGFAWLHVVSYFESIIWMSHKAQILGCPRLQVFMTFKLLGIVALFSRSKLRSLIWSYKVFPLTMIGKSDISLSMFLPLANIFLHEKIGWQKVGVSYLESFNFMFSLNIDFFLYILG